MNEPESVPHFLDKCRYWQYHILQLIESESVLETDGVELTMLSLEDRISIMLFQDTSTLSDDSFHTLVSFLNDICRRRELLNN